jgi:hypothetical protein
MCLAVTELWMPSAFQYAERTSFVSFVLGPLLCRLCYTEGADSNETEHEQGTRCPPHSTLGRRRHPSNHFLVVKFEGRAVSGGDEQVGRRAR